MPSAAIVPAHTCCCGCCGGPRATASLPTPPLPLLAPDRCRVAQLGEGESLALLAERYATSFGAIQGVNPGLENVTVLQ